MYGVNSQVLGPEPFHLFLEVLVNAGHCESRRDKLRGIVPIDMCKPDYDEVESGIEISF